MPHDGRSSRRDGFSAATLNFLLPVRAPFDGAGLLDFLAHRAVPGVEYVTGSTYARTLALPGGPATVDLRLNDRDDPAAVGVRLRLSDPGDAREALERCRRLIDADADATAIAAVLAADPRLAPTVARHPGARLPGAVDGPEIVTRALIGQQISVAAARTNLGRLTAAAGEPIETGDTRLSHLFPSPAALAALAPAVVGGPRRRIDTLLAAARDLASGALQVHAGRSAEELTAELVARPGIGRWTAGYVCMRVLGAADVLLDGDLVLRQGAARLGLPSDARSLSAHAQRWRPFRSYAGILLWRVAAQR